MNKRFIKLVESFKEREQQVCDEKLFPMVVSLLVQGFLHIIKVATCQGDVPILFMLDVVVYL